MEEKSAKRYVVSAPRLVAALGVLAPAAYLIGLNFYQGTLSAYGLDYESFPLSSPDVYVTAYRAFGHFLLAVGTLFAEIFKLMLSRPGVYWLLALFAVLLITLYAAFKYPGVNESAKRTRLCKIAVRLAHYLHWHNNAFTKAISFAGVLSYAVVVALTIVPMLAVLWWLVPYAAFQKAQQLENEKIADFGRHGCYVKEKQPWNNCFSLYDGDGKELVTGLLVAVGEKRAAFFAKDGSVVLEVPEGYRITRRYVEMKVGSEAGEATP